MSFAEAVKETRKPGEDEQEEEKKEVVFFAWVDAGTQSQPASTTIRISGGQRIRDTAGRIAPMDYLEVKFNAGMLRTDNPEVIREIRSMIKKGETITEDKEVYLSFIEPAERRSQRLAMKASVLTSELEHKEAEIRRLQRLLANRGTKAKGSEAEAE